MVQPFTPDDVLLAQSKNIPGFVIEGINNILKAKMRGNKAFFTQNEAMDSVIAAMPVEARNGLEGQGLRNYIFGNRWMDFEPLYRESGWKVDYDKPAYNESYEANFTFTRK